MRKIQKNSVGKKQNSCLERFSATFFILSMFCMGLFLVDFASGITWDNIAYYKLDETSGDVVDELNNYDGINNGTTRGATGKISNGFDFERDDAEDYVNLTNFNLDNNSLSISFWWKPESLVNYNFVITKWLSAGNHRGFIIGANSDGDLYLQISTDGSGSSTYTSSPVFSTGNWYHVVVTFDGTTLRGYSNGASILNQTGFSTIYQSSSAEVRIGNNHDFYAGGWTDGIVDEVGFWNRILNTSEISELYNSGNGESYPSSVSVESITLISPSNDSLLSTTGTNFTSNFNISSSYNYTWDNATYYVWNATNKSVFNSTNISLSGNNTIGNLFIDSFTLGDYEWNVYGCYSNATFSNCTWSSNGNFTFEVIPFTLISETYNNETLYGSTETFAANFSFLTGYRLSTLYFIYNGTKYLSTFDEYETNYYYASKSIIIPEVSAQTNLTFYWEATLENDFIQNSTLHNQTVNVIAIDNCAVYTNQIINITLYDEDTQSFLNGVTENTSIKLELILSSLNDNNEIVKYSHDFDEVNSATVCLQNALGNSSYRLDGLIEYTSLGRFTEYYYFQNYTLDSTTDDMNISLYNLNSTSGQEFKITYKDSNFVPVAGAILDIQRKYVDEGVFKTTERPKTGTEGYTVGHLVRNDVIYNIVVMKEGRILATFNDVIAACQNPLLTSCEINLNSYGSGSFPDDFRNANDITFTLNYNSSTRKVNSQFSIVSGATSTVNLNVTLFDRLGNTSVCSDTLTSSGGLLSCTVPASFGNSTIIATLYKDGDRVGQTIIKIKQNPGDIYGSSIIVIAMLFFLVVMGIGASSDNPMAMGISLIVGSIVLIAMNIIYSPSFVGAGATVLWFIVAIVLLLIKGSNRQ